jgi:ferric-dicitrate binding protein FerR (iron transport regulator)
MNRHGTPEEDEAVRRALDADRAPLPQPLWPLVRERLRRPSPRVRLAFALGGIAAAIVGLLAGVEFGSPRGLTADTPQATWTEVGSVLADGSTSTLDNVYLALGTESGSETR